MIDEDGFIRITGPREPVLEDRRRDGPPHPASKKSLATLIGHAEEGFRAAVTAVAGSRRKGERLIVVHTHAGQDARRTLQGLVRGGAAQPLHPVARQLPGGRGAADAGDRQARPETCAGNRPRTIFQMKPQTISRAFHAAGKAVPGGTDCRRKGCQIHPAGDRAKI